MLNLLLVLSSLQATDSWVVSRNASAGAWLSDLASGLQPYSVGVMDLYETGTLTDDVPGPGSLPDGVLRRRRLSGALQTNLEDTAQPFRIGVGVLYERGGWNRELSMTGGKGHGVTGATWGYGLFVGWRPWLEVGGGLIQHKELASPEGVLAQARTSGWGIVRVDRLSLLTEGTLDDLQMAELMWQVDPVYTPDELGMGWRELSLGARFVEADHNAWNDRTEIQGMLTMPVWRDRTRLLCQGSSEAPFERVTLQHDLLPQGMVGVDLSYARNRWATRDWGLRVRMLALTIGWNDPEDARDFGPSKDQFVLSARLHMTFDGPDQYYSPSRHAGPLEKIKETSKLR